MRHCHEHIGGSPARRLAAALFATIGVLGLVGVASAQPKGPSAERKAEVLETIKRVRMAKLTEVLEGVDQAKLEKVGEALERFDERIFEEAVALRQTMRRVRRGLKRGASDKDLDALTRAAVAHRRKLDDLRVEQYEAAAKHLDATARAKLLIFLPQFEQQVRKAMRRAKGDTDRRGKRRGRRRGGRRGEAP